MIALAATAEFTAAVERARSVALTSYTLRRGPVLGALIDAARRGADVRVRLERDPLDDRAGTLHRENAAALAALRQAGAHAESTGSGEPVLHLKAAVVDGVAWLDDRNWAGGGAERIVRDTGADDVSAVTRAVAGCSGSDGHLGTTKAAAVRLEAGVVAAAGAAPLDVETESFGPGTMYDALLHRAKAGLPTRLIVAGREAGESGNARERTELAHLASLGVEVRIGDVKRGDLDEKMAVTSRDAWLGSANATYARGVFGEQRDWGIATREPQLVDTLRSAFQTNWNRALPLSRSSGAR